jgi:hypothetical protein
MKNLKTLLNEAIPPPTTQQRSSGDAKMDFAFNAIQTLSKNVKFDDINKQQQFDNLILQIMQLIKG